MNNNNNETLKPGDRVRLTGWAHNDKCAISIFEKEGKQLPCMAKIKDTDFEGEFYVLNGWSLDHFTYEIIETDGNG